MTRNPFRIDGPASVAFSGGRTSAYMLHRILEAWDGRLPDDVHVTFQNTGKEMPETLDFVRDCAARWGVPITWLEFDIDAAPPVRIVDHATASRNGEPYKALIDRKGYLPNPVTRYCTSELKIRPAKNYMHKVLGYDHWVSVVGLRADEPRRVARATAPLKERWENLAPLARAGVTKRDVSRFWKSQPFDLALPDVNGSTPYGNCDLCFLKAAPTLAGILRDRPDLADWWIEAETTTRPTKPSGARFRMDRPDYALMLDLVQRQGTLPLGPAHDTRPCMCAE